MGPSEAIQTEVVGAPHGAAASPSAERVIFDLRSDDAATQSDAPPQVAPRPATNARPASPLHGQIVVVTGGSGGAGRDIALQFASAGARVCIIGNDVAQLRSTVELAGPQAAMVFLQCDVGSLMEIDGVVDFINRFDRPVDCIVHAESVRVEGTLGSGAVQDLDEQYLVNVRGPYVLTQRLLPRLIEARGRVVFTRRVRSGTFAQHDLVSEAIRSFADGLRAEVGESVAVSSIVADASVSDAVLSGALMTAVTAPAEVEVGEIHLRSRPRPESAQR